MQKTGNKMKQKFETMVLTDLINLVTHNHDAQVPLNWKKNDLAMWIIEAIGTALCDL